MASGDNNIVPSAGRNPRTSQLLFPATDAVPSQLLQLLLLTSPSARQRVAAASMAKQVVDEAFWLPSDILCDEFFHGGDKGGGERKGGLAGAGLRGELPFCFDSNLNSPVESVTETEESDVDEDFMAGLTKQMAHFFLQDEKGSSFAAEAAEGSKVGGQILRRTCFSSFFSRLSVDYGRAG